MPIRSSRFNVSKIKRRCRSGNEGYDRLDWVVLVVHGRRGAREVVDPVDLEEDWLDDVVADELESRVAEVVRDVVLAAREEVVDNDDTVPAGEELVDEVAADKPSATGDDDAQGGLPDANREAARAARGGYG